MNKKVLQQKVINLSTMIENKFSKSYDLFNESFDIYISILFLYRWKFRVCWLGYNSGDLVPRVGHMCVVFSC